MARADDLTEFTREMDLLIRQGRSREVRCRLEELLQSGPLTGLPRASLLPLAALCRRSGIPQKSVALLNPVVRPKARSPLRASAAEKVEYAGSLIQVGGTEEGLKLLESIDAESVAEAHLFAAFACMSQWDYPAASAHLNQYVSHPSLAVYPRQVGRLNLGAALAGSESFDEARKTLEALAEETRSQGSHLLTANAGLILAQIALETGNWQEAFERLEEARSLSEQVASIDRLLVEKWLAIFKLRRDGVNSSTLKALDEVRARAHEQRSFETLRDCDFHQARVADDEILLRHVHFGTPYPRYRERIARTAKIDSETPYEWKLGRGVRPTQLIDLNEGDLKPGQLLWRLTRILVSDFYRPQRIAALYGKLFPDQYYNPISSPWVIHQSVQRLRRCLKQSRYPFLIVSRGGGSFSFGARPHSCIALRIHSDERSASADPRDIRLEALFRQLKQEKGLKDALVGRGDAQRIWSVSQRSANTFLVEMTRKGWIRRVGSGPMTRYRLTQPE